MSTFALIDFKDFYVSCERIFNPHLEQEAIVILSHNNGCVVALSKEAERTGIRIGEPYFKCQSQCEQLRVHILSSNYEFYGDMSARVMACLQSYCPTLEVVAIDQVFMRLDSLPYFDLQKYFSIIQKEIKASTGIAITIGYAPTKTLAALANHIATNARTNALFSLCNPNQRVDILKEIPVEEIGGIDCRSALRLKKCNIITAQDLKNTDRKLLRRKFSVTLEKISMELNGEACLSATEIIPNRQIAATSTFHTPIASLDALQEAISTYTARACITLQTQHSVATGIYVFLHGNHTPPQHKSYANAISHHFTHPTADTSTIIASARHSLQKIYQYGYAYQKTGIMLLDIIPTPLLSAPHPGNYAKPGRVLKSLFFGVESSKQNMAIKRSKITRRYTTQWHELPVVNCN